MPNLAIINIADNSLASSIKPVKTRSDNTIAELASGPAGSQITVKVTSRQQPNQAHRAIVKVEMPIVATVDGVDKVIDTEIYEYNVRRSVYADAARVSAADDLFLKILASALVQGVTGDREGFW